MDARQETVGYANHERPSFSSRLEHHPQQSTMRLTDAGVKAGDILAGVDRLRCFVEYKHARTIPRIEGVDYVFDPEEDFDFFIAPTSPSDFADFLARCARPAAPMIAFADRPHPRADVIISALDRANLTTAMLSLEPLLKRTAALPPLPQGIDRSGLLALALMFTRNRSLTAHWQPYYTTLVDYPLLRGIENTRAVLEEMAEAGLLRRRFFQRVHLCTNCGSSRLHAREVCMSCHSSHLVEEPLVHHYSCAFQGPQSLFETADGYICPKCRKQLRHYGVDYDKPGSVTSCGDCGATLAEPDVGFTCVDCDSYTSGDHAAHRNWYHYDLLPDGVAALRSGELPHAGIGECDLRTHSVRDFRLFVERLVAIAQLHNRPLTICQFHLNTESLVDQAGQRGFLEICRFVRDLVAENLRQSDVLSSIPGGIFLCCMPETDRRRAKSECSRLHSVITRNLNIRIDCSISIIERDEATEYLRTHLRGIANVR